MKKYFVVLGSFLFLGVCISTGEGAHAKKNVVRVAGGTTIEKFGFVLDASYDPKLDDVVPGYRILNVALVNSSFNILMLNPEKDAWSLRMGKKGKSVLMITDLRRIDPEAWSRVPERARTMLSYPLVVPIGARLVIDLFVPKSVELSHVSEVTAYISSLQTTFEFTLRD